jgi:probable rRNA maturation factor
MSASRISIIVEEPAWKKCGVSLARIKSAARIALTSGLAENHAATTVARALTQSKQMAAEIALLLAGDDRLRLLNAAFRGRDCSTNVLSFPAPENACGHLGDVAIAFGVTSAEAASAGITMDAHLLHLVAHGVLHLLGYDHVCAREARIMENLEITILHRFGIADPYTRKVLAG